MAAGRGEEPAEFTEMLLFPDAGVVQSGETYGAVAITLKSKILMMLQTL